MISFTHVTIHVTGISTIAYQSALDNCKSQLINLSIKYWFTTTGKTLKNIINWLVYLQLLSVMFMLSNHFTYSQKLSLKTKYCICMFSEWTNGCLTYISVNDPVHINKVTLYCDLLILKLVKIHQYTASVCNHSFRLTQPPTTSSIKISTGQETVKVGR